MLKSMRTSVLQRALLTGVSLGSISVGSAEAITAGTPNILSYADANGSCRIKAQFSVTGDTSDISGFDGFKWGLSYQSGAKLFVVPTGAVIAVGTTNTTFNGANQNPLFVPPPMSGPEQIYFSVFEADANGIAGTIRSQVALSTIDLRAAGGDCLYLIPNNAPVANAGSDAIIAPGVSASLNGASSTDLEGDPLTYAWSQISGSPVSLTGSSTATSSFIAPTQTNHAQTFVFQLIVNDGLLSSAADTVSLTIPAGPNAVPIANAGPDVTVVPGATVALAGNNSSDGDNDPLTYAWTQVSGPSVVLSSLNVVAPSFVAPPKTAAQQQLVFHLVVNDGIVDSAPDAVLISLPANIGPTANAGSNIQVGGGTQGTLNASASTDGDGDALTYSWAQVSGSSVAITNPTSAQPTFIAPAPALIDQSLVFEVTVSDGLATSTSQVSVTVPANASPTVNAGSDQTAAPGATVTLSGTASDLESDPLTYQWTQTAGAPVTLSNATSLSPSFTAPQKTNSAQTLTFDLTANDGRSTSSPDSVDITLAANIGPTASAGSNRQVLGGSSVMLDASASADGDGDALDFSWTQVSGPSVTLTDANTASPTFTAPARSPTDQSLVFEVTADDHFGGVSTAQVTISVPANGAPVADAGSPQTVSGGASVSLNGAASSDIESDPLTYQWTQTAGPSVALTGANSANPSFTAPQRTVSAQTLAFELVVNDGIISSSPASVTVEIAANAAPVANAGGDQLTFGGGVVTLDAGASSDGDGDALTYSWTQTGGPSVTLTGANTAQPSFVAPLGLPTATTFTFEVEVSDGIAPATTDTVSVEVAPNVAPIANAGPDQGPIDGGQSVQLDGSGSSDPENQALTYTWTQLSGTQVQLAGPATAQPTFTAPLSNGNETLVFQLVVSDGALSSTADTVAIAVRAVGTVTLVQRVSAGQDRTFGFTSDITQLNASITTSSGVGQIAASAVAAGSHTVNAQDLTSEGYAIIGISCNDADSNINLADGLVNLALSPGEDLICTFTSANTRDAASQAIARFLATRNELVLAHQPDSQRRIDRLNGVAAHGSASVYGVGVPGTSTTPVLLAFNDQDGRAATSLSMFNAGRTQPEARADKFDVWFESQVSRIRKGDQKGDFRIAYVGADWKLSENVLLGGLVQYDDLRWDGALGAGEADGKGWMAGPYLTARIAPRMYVDVRAAWGSSDNEVSPLGTFVDDFKTARALYVASLTGDVDLDAKTVFRPTLSVRYVSDRQKGYVDQLSVTVPEQTVDQGDVSFSSRLHRDMALGRGWTARPYAEAEAIISFGAEALGFNNDTRARVKLGADFTSKQGVRAGFGMFRDGVGVADFTNTGVNLSFSVGF